MAYNLKKKKKTHTTTTKQGFIK